MKSDPSGSVDKWVRSLAYDVLCLRDRLSGWQSHRNAFLASLKMDRESLAREAEDALRRILRHAYESSTYYSDLWRTIGFDPSLPFVSDDIRQLPFLTKDIIKEKKELLVSSRFQKTTLDLSYTGGTTGTQTSFFLDHACTVSRVGRQWGMLDYCGYRPGMRRAMVWGVHTDLPPRVGALPPHTPPQSRREVALLSIALPPDHMQRDAARPRRILQRYRGRSFRHG